MKSYESVNLNITKTGVPGVFISPPAVFNGYAVLDGTTVYEEEA